MTPEEIIRDIYSPRIKRVVVDCDAGADGDDQFALGYALTSPERLRVVGVNSAPFNCGREMAEEGAAECADIMRAAGFDGVAPVCTGSPGFITREGVPLASEASDSIAALAKGASEDDPLYVVITGCCTNVASALALHPEIRKNVVTVWLALDNLAGNHNTGEYNYHNDIEAGKLLFSLSENTVLVCAGCVVAPFARSNGQVTRMFGAGGRLSRFLTRRFLEIPWAVGLWDLSAYGLLILPEQYRVRVSPLPEFAPDGEISGFSATRRIVLADRLNAQAIIRDAVTKISGLPEEKCIFE